jgi:Fe-S-cluster containining protein
VPQDPNRIYFTWPDGRFTYDCSGCGECCKGHGIGLDAAGGQVDDLVRLYPGLTPFLRKRGATWTAFNPRGQCWFLTGEGLCRVERDHGRDVKPASCRLFPFNRIFRMGAWMIVDYNSVICPLQVVAADDARGIAHASVVDDIAATRDPAIVGTELEDEDGQRFVTRERGIARACFAAADSASPDLAAAWSAQAREGVFEPARSRMARALESLCGLRPAVPAGATARAALWLTPSMRFNELFGPRDYAPRAELAQIFADMWLAWMHFVAQGAELAGRDLGLREATSIWSEQMPLCYLAARWGQAPTVEVGGFVLPGDDDIHDVVRGFIQAAMENRARRRPLSELLEPLLAPLSAAERVVASRMLAPLLPSIRWRRLRTR